jgi:hypothetical protein
MTISKNSRISGGRRTARGMKTKNTNNNPGLAVIQPVI